ncbi:uncharacterized protein Fot_01652 [Forsythia ovata]|uniref:C2 NT-type domain-containing protein n=1 Tax=Forsythia ovata TaxID=205694 RepID=A0ABD1X7L3_9LAMI
MSIKGAEGNTFQKNCVEFNLYEPRRDKTVKGQLLGTTILDLADYGVVKESLSVNAPIISKRTYRNTAQPLLFLKIQSFEKSQTSSSSRDSLTGEASMDRNHGESVSALMSEEYAEEAKVSTFTDDDISSYSSLAASSVVESIGYSSPQDKEVSWWWWWWWWCASSDLRAFDIGACKKEEGGGSGELRKNTYLNKIKLFRIYLYF